HITGGHIETIDKGPRSFQPMNVNFGLLPPLGYDPPRAAPPAADGGLGPRNFSKKRALCARALADLEAWIVGALPHAAE
ncbi:MAG TPA: FADH(2)-oxidizing methylenetetrahydrofolate--tRNA-(uracil(54)-C(5))-methyltransferase TrmFO, partial [Xanthobacteraceae bacterium]|nr:FADH(2)-oxidizing methylenetetrahydrofolate--tRNA-(uracil(54)-C(5))-methyltransferase TrmFO [Xanthobacteraceae bacterium]